MARTVVGSILHGAYGDLYEQAICLKHYAATHPEIDLKLYAATTVRLESFQVLDLSFASSFELCTTIDEQVERFFQFQIFDPELNEDVLSKLPATILAKFDREHNILPWNYLRDHHLVPTPPQYQLGLSKSGEAELEKVSVGNNISPGIWSRPTVNFLWRYRKPGLGTISNFGQKTQEKLLADCTSVFARLIERFDIQLLVCGMNIVTDETNRARTDDKFTSYGLNLPAANVTYMKGLSWPLELEIAARADVCCGHASGFTEGLWLKRGQDMVLMDAPPHYLAKAAKHRMPLFGLTHSTVFLQALLQHSPDSYYKRIAAMLEGSRKL